MNKKPNKNDRPLTKMADLRDEVSYGDFEFKSHFVRLCRVQPEVANERLVLASTNRDKIDRRGMVYALCIGGKIFKIGCTITDFASRVQSYNCGKKAFRASGTCSTTNYFILQSILNLGRPVAVYAYFPKLMRYDIFGKRGEEPFPSPKAVEKEVLRRFVERHGRVPIGCTQK